MTLRRWLAICGVVSPLLIALAFTVVGGDTPDEKSSAEKVVTYFHAHQTAGRVAALMVVIGAVLLVLFAARLREVLRSAGDGGVLPTASFGGAVLTAGGLGLMAAVHFALIQAAQHRFDAPAQTLNVLDENDFFLTIAGFAVFFLGSGLAIVRVRTLPQWLGWVAIVIAVLCVAGPLGFIGLVAGLLWILVVAVILLVRKGTDADIPRVPQPVA